MGIMALTVQAMTAEKLLENTIHQFQYCGVRMKEIPWNYDERGGIHEIVYRIIINAMRGKCKVHTIDYPVE